MTLNEHPELLWLTLFCALSALAWVPYILLFIAQQGPVKALLDTTGIHEFEPGWGQRAKRAHYNTVENLAVFAPLVLTVVILGVGDAITEIAALVFFVTTGTIGFYACYWFVWKIFSAIKVD